MLPGQEREKIRFEERTHALRKDREAKVVAETKPFRQRNKAVDQRCSCFANNLERKRYDEYCLVSPIYHSNVARSSRPVSHEVAALSGQSMRTERSGAVKLYSAVRPPIPCPFQIDLHENPVAGPAARGHASTLLPARRRRHETTEAMRSAALSILTAGTSAGKNASGGQSPRSEAAFARLNGGSRPAAGQLARRSCPIANSATASQATHSDRLCGRSMIFPANSLSRSE